MAWVNSKKKSLALSHLDVCFDHHVLFFFFVIAGKLWIPATIINIAFVKPALRVLYDNLIFFVWTVYLSIRLNAK